MDKKPFPIQRVFLNSISLNKFGYNTQKEKKHIKNLSYSNGYFPYSLKFLMINNDSITQIIQGEIFEKIYRIKIKLYLNLFK